MLSGVFGVTPMISQWLLKKAKRKLNRVFLRNGIIPAEHNFGAAAPPIVGHNALVFDTIYDTGYWGVEESRSGPGSSVDHTKKYRMQLLKFLNDFGAGSMFDAPCGDLNWMRILLQEKNISYIGGDISDVALAIARERRPDLDIRHFDICSDPFPDCDVWHCRECLQHLSLADAKAALENFSRSSIPYAIITTMKIRWPRRNSDIASGGFRPLDLELAPISLPPPIKRAPEERKSSGVPTFVGVWRRDQIASAINK